MKCRSYTHILRVKCLVVLTFQPDIVLVEFLEISCRILSMTITVINWAKVSYYSRSDYTNWGIQQRNDWCVWLWFLFLRRVSWDQRCSETPQSVTKKMDIRGLYSAKAHCYLQYSQLYSTSFEITNWIDYFITIICLFSYNVEERISANDNEYGSNGCAVWLTTTPSWLCGSNRE